MVYFTCNMHGPTVQSHECRVTASRGVSVHIPAVAAVLRTDVLQAELIRVH